MTTTTATFREYAEDNGSRYLIVNTDYVGPEAVCRLTVQNDDVLYSIEFDRDTARLLGTSLIHWADNPSLWADYTWQGTRGELHVIVEDGAVTLYLDSVSFALEFEGDAIDLGQRLIVFAGVNLPSEVTS